jgi:hypothetical protein
MRGFQNLLLKTDPEKLHGWSFSGNCKIHENEELSVIWAALLLLI